VESGDALAQVFIKFLRGQVHTLPWIEKSPTTTDGPAASSTDGQRIHLAKETSTIIDKLIALNEKGFLTINSQPRVNGVPSTDAVFGWGPEGGYVFQKAYLEFFTSPEKFYKLKEKLDSSSNITYHAVNKKGESFTNSK